MVSRLVAATPMLCSSTGGKLSAGGHFRTQRRPPAGQGAAGVRYVAISRAATRVDPLGGALRTACSYDPVGTSKA